MSDLGLQGGYNSAIRCGCGGYIDRVWPDTDWYAGRCEDCGVWTVLGGYVDGLLARAGLTVTKRNETTSRRITR